MMDDQTLARWDESLRKKAELKMCCKHRHNLVLIQEDIVLRTALRACKVCGTRHRYMLAEPGQLFSRPG